MTDETSYSTPWDIEDDPLYSDEEEYFDEVAWDDERAERNTENSK